MKLRNEQRQYDGDHELHTEVRAPSVQIVVEHLEEAYPSFGV